MMQMACEMVVPAIAQLVERRTVEEIVAILRSLVRIRLVGGYILKLFNAVSDF